MYARAFSTCSRLQNVRLHEATGLDYALQTGHTFEQLLNLIKERDWPGRCTDCLGRVNSPLIAEWLKHTGGTRLC